MLTGPLETERQPHGSHSFQKAVPEDLMVTWTWIKTPRQGGRQEEKSSRDRKEPVPRLRSCYLDGAQERAAAGGVRQESLRWPRGQWVRKLDAFQMGKKIVL